jgi:hypothetical protein
VPPELRPIIGKATISETLGSKTLGHVAKCPMDKICGKAGFILIGESPDASAAAATDGQVPVSFSPVGSIVIAAWLISMFFRLGIPWLNSPIRLIGCPAAILAIVAFKRWLAIAGVAEVVGAFGWTERVRQWAKGFP